MAGMTKLLRKAIRRAREVPAHDQDAVASVMLAMLDERTGGTDLDEDTLAAFEEGLAQAELAGFVAPEIGVDLDAPDGTELIADPGPPADGSDGSTGGEGRVFPLLPAADPDEWMVPKPPAMSSASGLVFSAAHAAAPAATGEHASNSTVRDDQS